MKQVTYSICIFIVVFLSLNFYHINSGPVISELTYDKITQTSVTLTWITDSPADSKFRWKATNKKNYKNISKLRPRRSKAINKKNYKNISKLRPLRSQRITKSKFKYILSNNKEEGEELRTIIKYKGYEAGAS